MPCELSGDVLNCAVETACGVTTDNEGKIGKGHVSCGINYVPIGSRSIVNKASDKEIKE